MFALSNCAVGMSVRNVSWLMIDVGTPRPLWAVPPLIRQTLSELTKAAEQTMEYQEVSSFPPWLLLRFLPSVNTLASLNGRLYPPRGIDLSFPKLLLGMAFHHSREN